MNFLGLAIQGVGLVKGIAEGRRQKALLEQQGQVLHSQAVQTSDAIGREYRQIAGRQAAAMAENGGAYEGSNLKLLHQSEATAFLDRLYTLYHGELGKLGLETEGETALRNAFLQGTQSLAGGMGGMSGMFPGRGTVPSASRSLSVPYNPSDYSSIGISKPSGRYGS